MKTKQKTIKITSDLAKLIHQLIDCESEGRSINILLRYLSKRQVIGDDARRALLYYCCREAKTQDLIDQYEEDKTDPVTHSKNYDEMADQEFERLEKLFMKGL